MVKLYIVVGFLLSAVLLLPGSASAQEYNRMITVYAAVPEQRVIYLDDSGNIIKIAGNTARNITPAVLDSSGNKVVMTPAVQNRYDDFLREHKGHLQASKTYDVNPMTVDNSPNVQSIGLGGTDLSLVGLQIH